MDSVLEKLRASKGLLDGKVVCEWLGLHKITLHGWTKAGKIPHVRLAGRVKFDPATLADWYSKRLVG